jgi:hypothetical protein
MTHRKRRRALRNPADMVLRRTLLRRMWRNVRMTIEPARASQCRGFPARRATSQIAASSCVEDGGMEDGI